MCRQPPGDTAHWTHQDPKRMSWDVTATLVNGELRVHYAVSDRPRPPPGVASETATELYHGDGVFRR
jgi:hypothetical protein